jgi:hypothetical protein
VTRGDCGLLVVGDDVLQAGREFRIGAEVTSASTKAPNLLVDA